MVVGFHHKKGSLVEYVYPPLNNLTEASGQIGITLPKSWKDLPSLALPDGAHKFGNDVVYFHLPSIDEPKRTIFAVSCLMQVKAENYMEKDPSVTRSSVLKSICVLSAVPLFGLISSKVVLATEVWFRQEDFNDFDLLKDLHKSLTVAVPKAVCPDTSILNIDLDLRATVLKFGVRLIRLFKALLLEPKIIFLVEPTADMSKIILGFLSLYPSMLEKGLLLSAVSPHLAPAVTPSFSSARHSDSNSDVQQIEKPAFDPSVVQSSIDLISRSLISDDTGLPLPIFGPENACLPYVSVTFLERLPLLSSFLVGCTNILFLHKCDHDVSVTDENTGYTFSSLPSQQHSDSENFKLKVTFKDRLLKKILKPTASDERFIGWILSILETESKTSDPYFAGSNWVASDEWIREQFRRYLLGLLSAVAHNNEKSLDSYGVTYITAWKRKLSYSVWSRSIKRESYPTYIHPGDDPSMAANHHVHSSIFGATSLATISGASAAASASASQFSIKAADSAKKLFGRAGGLMSSVFGGGNGNHSNHSRTSRTSEADVRARISSEISADLDIHSSRTVADLPPEIPQIDDRGCDPFEFTKKSEEAESEF